MLHALQIEPARGSCARARGMTAHSYLKIPMNRFLNTRRTTQKGRPDGGAPFWSAGPGEDPGPRC